MKWQELRRYIAVYYVSHWLASANTTFWQQSCKVIEVNKVGKIILIILSCPGASTRLLLKPTDEAPWAAIAVLLTQLLPILAHSYPVLAPTTWKAATGLKHSCQVCLYRWLIAFQSAQPQGFPKAALGCVGVGSWAPSATCYRCPDL